MDLRKKINHYHLLCLAGVAEDMAKRIMYSILPAVADPIQVKHTEGVVDYKALEYAVEGYEKIINFGLQACVDELYHYGKTGRKTKEKENAAEKAAALLGSGRDLEVANFCIELFNDLYAWEPSYGGKKWAKIAEAIKEIIILDDMFKKATTPSEKIAVMKQMVVALNVFDGLSHNTASVMDNIVEKEYPSIPYSQLEKKMKEVQKLMDMKELSNHIDVYKGIEQKLQDSGDINKFREWVGKLRRDPKYHESRYKDTAEELIKIRLKKDIIHQKDEFDIYKNIDEMKAGAGSIFDFLTNVNQILLFETTVVDRLYYGLSKFLEDKDIINKISNIISSLASIRQETYAFRETLTNKLINPSRATIHSETLNSPFPSKESILTKDFNKIIELVNRFMYILDSWF